jgi:hypothetical protein
MSEPTAANRLGLTERQAAFNADLLGEDPLGMVIRAHIHIENQLIEFIEAALAAPDQLKSLNLDYAGRVSLALALGLHPEFGKPLRSLGTMRNHFAHRLDAGLGAQEANNLQKALGPHLAITLESYRETLLKRGDQPKRFDQLEPIDRIQLFLVTLWSGVAIAAIKMKGRHDE